VSALDRFFDAELATWLAAQGIDISPGAVSEALRSKRLQVDALDELTDTVRKDLRSLEASKLEIEQALQRKSSFEFPVATLVVPEPLPVCLSGLDCFNLKSGTSHRRQLLILNVIPESAVTYFVISTAAGNREFLDRYFDRVEGLLAVINTVEAAMLHATDHWFLRPSVWTTLPKERRKTILAELMFKNTNSLDWTPLSIFDEARSRVLDEIEAAYPESVRTENQREVIASERAKLVS